MFRRRKFGAVAGCMVVEGVVKRNKPIRVLRDNVVIFEGELESLRRFKDNVDEVRNGTECGIGVKKYNDVKPGDQIECFERIEVERTLWPDPVRHVATRLSHAPTASRSSSGGTLGELIRRELRDHGLVWSALDAKSRVDDLATPRSSSRCSARSHSRRRRFSKALAPQLRCQLGRALGMRHVPELHFDHDELIESGARLSELLQKAVKDDAARHGDDEDKP